MADSASPGEMPPALARPVTVSEFRAHLAEMIGRAERGEEVVISRGTQPVAKLVPLGRRRRLGGLRELICDRDLAALVAAIESPLTPGDQDAVEGSETDLVGISRR
jgi:prevent-host-death family protein